MRRAAPTEKAIEDALREVLPKDVVDDLIALRGSELLGGGTNDDSHVEDNARGIGLHGVR